MNRPLVSPFVKLDGFWLLVGLICMSVFAGCQNPRSYNGNEFWIFVPNVGWRGAAPVGYPVEVALPRERYTTNRISVHIVGEVQSPGVLRVPEGCSLLQAIGHAGGFSPFAFPQRVRLIDARGQSRLLRLTWAKDQDHWRVWYEVQPTKSYEQRLDAKTETDFVLRENDTLHIGKLPW